MSESAIFTWSQRERICLPGIRIGGRSPYVDVQTRFHCIHLTHSKEDEKTLLLEEYKMIKKGISRGQRRRTSTKPQALPDSAVTRQLWEPVVFIDGFSPHYRHKLLFYPKCCVVSMLYISGIHIDSFIEFDVKYKWKHHRRKRIHSGLCAGE